MSDIDINNGLNEEISLKLLFKKIQQFYFFLKKKWLFISIAVLIGGLIGFLYSTKQPPNYVAKLTFIVEDAKGNGGALGGLASIAGQFGVDVGGSNVGGVLSTDNILLYFKSESIAREVLLTEFDSSSNKTLADKYIEIYDLKHQWQEALELKNIDFSQVNTPEFPNLRLYDSLLKIIIKDIFKSQFSISRTDKKAGFIEVNTIMQNEELAKLYCERIVKVAVDRYINIKTKRQKATVDKLQARVDSVAYLLVQKTVSVANLQTTFSVMDINPIYKTGTSVNLETNSREKTMLSTIFASIVQNLELAKFTLSQETPSIQIIDSPTSPLKVEEISKLKITISTAISFLLLAIIFLSIQDLIKKS